MKGFLLDGSIAGISKRLIFPFALARVPIAVEIALASTFLLVTLVG